MHTHRVIGLAGENQHFRMSGKSGKLPVRYHRVYDKIPSSVHPEILLPILLCIVQEF